MANNNLERKPVIVTEKCLEMLDEAIEYLKGKSPNQAEIMSEQFFSAIKLLETMPGIGVKYKRGMKKISLGKFRYNI